MKETSPNPTITFPDFKKLSPAWLYLLVGRPCRFEGRKRSLEFGARIYIPGLLRGGHPKDL